MSTTTTPQKTVTTDAQTTDDDSSFERRSWNYAYIGEDKDGRHHHVDRVLERIVVTAADRTRDDSGAVPTFTVEGPILHAQPLEDDDTLREWIAFVDSDEMCGWHERPVSAVDTLRDVLTEGM